MSSIQKGSSIVQHDSHEWLKRRIFQRLNELARTKDIAVTYPWAQQKDPATNCYDSVYQSTGPEGLPDTCLFCGWGHKSGKDFVPMGTFVADPQRHYDFRVRLSIEQRLN
jgi:hypothetical protein